MELCSIGGLSIFASIFFYGVVGKPNKLGVPRAFSTIEPFDN